MEQPLSFFIKSSSFAGYVLKTGRNRYLTGLNLQCFCLYWSADCPGGNEEKRRIGTAPAKEEADDNENSYTSQMVRTIKYFSNVK
jgi:hypothetical protein